MTARLGHDVTGPPDAPALLLGSALGTDRRMWDESLPVLATRLRVVRYDHRGHGASPVPPGPYRLADLAGDVLALADSLGLRRFHLGGLSLGGMVAMWLAVHHPERVDSLVLCCTSAYLPPSSGWTGRAATVRVGGTASVADAVTARWFTEDFPARQPDVPARARAMLLATPSEGYAGCCEAIAGMDLRDGLGAVGAPTLVIAARQDRATPPEHSDRIVAGITGSRLLLLDDAAHLAAMQHPRQCADEMLSHVCGDES
jgi:3-oxoadipate enol-lactonase